LPDAERWRRMSTRSAVLNSRCSRNLSPAPLGNCPHAGLVEVDVWRAPRAAYPSDAPAPFCPARAFFSSVCASAQRTKGQESTLTVNRKGTSDQREDIMMGFWTTLWSEVLQSFAFGVGAVPSGIVLVTLQTAKP